MSVASFPAAKASESTTRSRGSTIARLPTRSHRACRVRPCLGSRPIVTNRLLLITCEHAGNRVPGEFRHLFEGRHDLLQTHRGWDPGALTLAQEMSEAFEAPLLFTETTRLLIDVNRSLRTPDLHSEITKTLPIAERREIVRRYWQPHRERVEGWVRRVVAQGHAVVHIASHSFTPELKGHVRTADVGFLYDPRRPGEVDFSSRWFRALQARRPDLRLRRNYPYLGRSDGVTLRLRREHPPERYVGIELEVNQRFVERGGPAWTGIRASLVASMREALGPAPQTRPGEGAAARETTEAPTPIDAARAESERIDP